MGPHGIFLSSWFHHDHIKEAKAHSHLIAPRHAINNKYNKNRCPLSPRSTIIRRTCFVIVPDGHANTLYRPSPRRIECRQDGRIMVREEML